MFQVLTAYYERCGRYYSHGGWGSFGAASEEEKRLTMMLFSGIFDSLGQRVCIFDVIHHIPESQLIFDYNLSDIAAPMCCCCI